MPLSPLESQQLQLAAEQLGIVLPDSALDSIGRYIDLILQWRHHARLVARSQSRTDIIQDHVVDSLAVVRHIDGPQLLDIGSGAGFPGVPVAIVRPAEKVTLLEPNRRKANFLRDVLRQLVLKNAAVEQSRAEELMTVARQRYHVVTSRAVWALSDLVSCARRLLAPGGLIIAMKGPRAEAEVAESDLENLHLRLESIEKYLLPSGHKRALVLIRSQDCFT